MSNKPTENEAAAMKTAIHAFRLMVEAIEESLAQNFDLDRDNAYSITLHSLTVILACKVFESNEELRALQETQAKLAQVVAVLLEKQRQAAEA